MGILTFLLSLTYQLITRWQCEGQHVSQEEANCIFSSCCLCKIRGSVEVTHSRQGLSAHFCMLTDAPGCLVVWLLGERVYFTPTPTPWPLGLPVMDGYSTVRIPTHTPNSFRRTVFTAPVQCQGGSEARKTNTFYVSCSINLSPSHT